MNRREPKQIVGGGRDAVTHAHTTGRPWRGAERCVSCLRLTDALRDKEYGVRHLPDAHVRGHVQTLIRKSFRDVAHARRFAVGSRHNALDDQRVEVDGPPRLRNESAKHVREVFSDAVSCLRKGALEVAIVRLQEAEPDERRRCHFCQGCNNTKREYGAEIARAPRPKCAA